MTVRAGLGSSFAGPEEPAVLAVLPVDGRFAGWLHALLPAALSRPNAGRPSLPAGAGLEEAAADDKVCDQIEYASHHFS